MARRFVPLVQSADVMTDDENEKVRHSLATGAPRAGGGAAARPGRGTGRGGSHYLIGSPSCLVIVVFRGCVETHTSFQDLCINFRPE